MSNVKNQKPEIELAEDGVDIERRRALTRLGLTAAVAYAAPTLLSLTSASADEGSGGDSGHGGDDDSSGDSSDSSDASGPDTDSSSDDGSSDDGPDDDSDDEATLPSESSDSE